MPDDQFPQVELSPHFKNVASVMAAAGYNVVYKGKWHLSKPVGSQFEPSDVAKYGFRAGIRRTLAQTRTSTSTAAARPTMMAAS